MECNLLGLSSVYMYLASIRLLACCASALTGIMCSDRGMDKKLADICIYSLGTARAW